MSDLNCPFCGQAFTSIHGLKIHQGMKHKWPFICFCKKIFETERGLKIHAGMTHKNTKKTKHRKLQMLRAAKKYNASAKGRKRTKRYEKTLKAKTRTKSYEKSIKGHNRRQKYRHSTKGKQTQARYAVLKKELKESKKRQQKNEEEKKERELAHKQWLEEVESDKKFFRHCDLWRYKNLGLTADDLRWRKEKWKREFGTDDYYNDTNQCLKVIEKRKPIENMHAERKFLSGWYLETRNYVVGMSIDYVRKEEKDLIPLPVRKVTLVEFKGNYLLVKPQKGWCYEIHMGEILVNLPCEPVQFTFNWSVR